MSRAARASLVLAFVAALAPACRQVAGIHVVQSQEAECDSCVDQSCAASVSACNGNASCASRLDCALGCDPTSASCVPTCQGKAVGDAVDLGPVEACMAASCASACELSWGGILPITPPSAASACAACIGTECSSEDEGCAENAGCATAMECARSETTVDALEWCEEVGYPTGAQAYASLATCVQASCSEACDVGSDWACVGNVSFPMATATSITGTLTVVSAANHSQAIPGLTVDVCFADDVNCQNPVSPPVVTDANGAATLTLPTMQQAGPEGFIGFLKVTDPTNAYYTTLAYAGAPITHTGSTRTIVMVPPSLATNVAGLTGAPPDPTRAFLIVSVVDCAGAYGANASFTIEPSDSETKVLYTRNDLPDQAATATDTGGTAIVLNALPGAITVTTRVAGVSAVVATTEAYAQANTVTLVLVTPTP